MDLPPTPQHVDASEPIAIPTEICTHIIEIVLGTTKDRKGRKQVLASLTRVSRLFNAICIPLLFRDLAFPATMNGSGAKFCREVIERDPSAVYLATCVRSCIADGWTPGKGLLTGVYERIYRMHMQAISAFANLHTVEFRRTPILLATWNALASLPSLKTLRFSSCVFYPHSVEDFISTGFTPLLHTFVLHDSCFLDDGFPRDPYLARAIFTDSLRVAQIDSYKMVTAIADVTDKLRLQELALVMHQNERSVEKILERVSTVRTLSLNIYHASRIRWPSFIVASTCLPALRSLRCSLEHAKELLNHRPVETLCLILPALSLSCDIFQLIIRTLLDTWTVPSSLLHLMFDSESPCPGFRTGFPQNAWSPFEGVVEQRSLVEGIANSFPNLQTLRIHASPIQWRRDGGADWEHFLVETGLVHSVLGASTS